MCGRVNNHLTELHSWEKMFSNWPKIQQGYNVAPSASLTTFISASNKTLVGKNMRWGMIPKWASKFESKYNTFNARIESINEKPTFRSAWKNQQKCLIPIAGYYEWQTPANGDKKQPFYITDRNIGGLVLAGLYENWGEETEKRASCTVITKPATVGLRKIHFRMPIMLTVESAQSWIESSFEDDQEFLVSCELPEVVYWPVSTDIGNTRNNHPEICKPIDIS